MRRAVINPYEFNVDLVTSQTAPTRVLALQRSGIVGRTELTELKVLGPFLLVLLSVTCQNTPVRPPLNSKSDIGVAVEKAGHACLYIVNSSLSPGQRVQFITATTPQAAGEAEILVKADETCKDSGQDQSSVIHYSLKTTQGALRRAAPAFAIANFSRALTPTETGMAADLDGDGQLESFRACTSSEGVHLTVWKGKPLEGLRKWHYYYYLGYNVTSDCTEADTKPDTK
jgi:hypothetical protein